MMSLMTILMMIAGVTEAGIADSMSRQTTVGFRLQVNLIIIKVEVNGVQKDFILDTGASCTTIRTSFIEELGITEVEKMKARGVGGEVDAAVVRIDSISVGDITLHDFTCGVVNMQDMSCVIGGDIAGVLGFDFLSQFMLTIDYRKKQLVLNKYPEEPMEAIVINGDRFESTKYRISITRVDSSWQFNTATPLPEIPVIIQKENSSGAVRVQVQALHGMTLDDVLKLIEPSLKARIEGYTEISSSRQKGRSGEYYIYEYTGKKDGKDLHFKHAVFKEEEFLCNLYCSADPDEYEKLIGDFERMIDSFAFLKK